MLPDKGADVNNGDCEGVTPLMRTAEKSSQEVVEFLLRVEGVNIKLKDIEGKTALSLATSGEHWQIVELLKKSQ
jgi:ankyrin repeat protein